MSSYKFLYLIWLLPLYLLFLTTHQVLVYNGLEDTYENGSSYTAGVKEFDIKQIASQTNGYVILEFETADGTQIERKLTLPVELAGMIAEYRQVPVRYREGAFEEIVIMAVYPEHRNMTLSNAAISFLGLLIALGVAWTVHRYARRRGVEGKEEIVFERVD